MSECKHESSTKINERNEKDKKSESQKSPAKRKRKNATVNIKNIQKNCIAASECTIKKISTEKLLRRCCFISAPSLYNIHIGPQLKKFKKKTAHFFVVFIHYFAFSLAIIYPKKYMDFDE